MSKSTSSSWGEINGVRLTSVDEKHQYANDTLGMVLDSQDSGRHVARVAHLYFARTPTLTQQDLETNIISLVKRILGPSPMDKSVDWGWFGHSFLPSLPKNLYEEICKDLNSTFEEDKKWNSEELKAFRVVQLVHPQEKQSLFQVIYVNKKNSLFQYLFPISDLPVKTQQILKMWKAGLEAVRVPLLYLTICHEDTQRVIEGFLQLDLPDWFTFRFLNWFVGNSIKSNLQNPSQQQQLLLLSDPKTNPPKTKQLLNFYSDHLPDFIAGNPPLEILLAYLSVFIPYKSNLVNLLKKLVSSTSSTSEEEFKRLEQQLKRHGAVFRWGISDLWLNRISGISEGFPANRLFYSIYVFLVHITGDPDLVSPDEEDDEKMLSLALAEYRAPLYHFFLYVLREAPSSSFENETSFDRVIDLWSVYLTPWRVTTRLKRTMTETASLFLSNLPAFPHSGGKEFADTFSLKSIWFVILNHFHYVAFLRKSLSRLDEENSPSLQALESFLRTFSKDGPLCSPVLGIMLACESLLHSSHKTNVDELSQVVPTVILNDSKKMIEFVFENRNKVLNILTIQRKEIFGENATFESSGKICELLDLCKPAVQSFLREFNHKVKTQKSGKIHSASSLTHSEEEIVLRMQKIFSIQKQDLDVLETATTPGSNFSNNGNPFALPDVEFKMGVPSWLKTKSKTIRTRFLTPKGKLQIQKGERVGGPELAAQYVGKFYQRPIEMYEIPILVKLSILLMDSLENSGFFDYIYEHFGINGIDIRSLVDSRNILWVLVGSTIFDLIKWRGYYMLWLISFSIYSIGAGMFRGIAQYGWNFAFLLLWFSHYFPSLY